MEEKTQEQVMDEIASEYKAGVVKQEETMLNLAKSIQQQMFSIGKPKFTFANLLKQYALTDDACREMIDTLKLGGFIRVSKDSSNMYLEIQTGVDDRIANMKLHAAYLENLATTYMMMSKHVVDWMEHIKPSEKEKAQ